MDASMVSAKHKTEQRSNLSANVMTNKIADANKDTLTTGNKCTERRTNQTTKNSTRDQRKNISENNSSNTVKETKELRTLFISGINPPEI